jgi:ATP-dependent helicase/nuclease subunit B
MRRLIVAGSNSELCSALLPVFDGSEILLLAATKRAADELVWNATAGVLGVHRLTLIQLAAQLAAARVTELGLVPMSQLAQEALVARAAHELRTSGGFRYFQEITDTPGFVRSAARTINELRLNSIRAKDLEATGAPGADLARLLQLYDRQRSEAKLADLAVLFQFASEVGPHPLLSLPVALLDVPVRTIAAESLLQMLIARAPACTAASLEGDRESVEALSRLLEVLPDIPAAADRNTAIQRVRHFLFSAQSPPEGALDETVECFSSPGESFECTEIARRAMDYVKEGVGFDRMAIVLRNPDRYQPLVEEALRRAGIPGWFSHGTLRPDPAGRAFLALLQCAAEDYSASRFAEYLSLAQIPNRSASAVDAFQPSQDEVIAALQHRQPPAEDAADDAAAPVAPYGWEQILVDAAVIGGLERWKRRLEGLHAEIQAQILEFAESEPQRRTALQFRLARLEQLSGFALPLIERLDRLPREAKWGDWIAALQSLAQVSLRQPQGVQAVLSELFPMADVGPVTLDEVYGILRERLGVLRSAPAPRRFGGIFVGTMEEVRGSKFEVVFLPGLAEGLFPKRLLEDPLLLDEFRERLHLPQNNLRAERERLLLKIALAAGNRVVVSYPRMDTAQSRSRVPSFYALEVIRAAEGHLPDLRNLAERTRQAASGRLGWPAPDDPKYAIDDAEYDLAVLGRILKAPDQPHRGEARYLVTQSETLARSMRSRWMRWDRKWRPSDGLVNAHPALEAHRLGTRPYSPTSLQRYAVCPYQFFLHSIYGLDEREEPRAIEQMDALTRGTLFHEVQHQILEELQPWSQRPLAELLDVTDRVLDQVAAKFEEEWAPAIPRVWRSEIEDMRTDLRGWTREMSRSPEWIPVAAEFEFRDARLNPFLLRGKIDLIEKNTVTGALRVTDHKTGRAPEQRPAFVGGGTILQPLLYAMALAAKSGEPVATGRLFYCTQRGGYTETEIRVTATAQSHAERVLDAIDTAVASGFLVSAPTPGACERCDYRLVCGPYEEQRASRKSKLMPLLQIREMP